MRRRKSNPSSSQSMFLVLGAAVAGYFAYINNAFAGMGFPYSTVVPTTPVSGSGAAALSQGNAAGSATASPAAAAVAAVPPLGTPVTTSDQLTKQVAANYPYIFPSAAVQGSAPAGYSTATDATASETGAGNGIFYLRNDVANALLPIIGNGASLVNLYSFPISNIGLVKQIMASKGLSGLGYVNARSSFPYNPIMQGVQIVNTPPHGGWN